MSRSIVALAIAALTTGALVGCASSTEADAASGEGAIGVRSQHATRLAQCDRAAEAANERAATTAEMTRVQSGLLECARRANDAVVAEIEANLEARYSSYASQTETLLDRMRTNDERFCAELDKASGDFGGTMAHLGAVTCRAGRERFLGALVDAYVAFGGEATPIPEQREAHARCYEQYDRVLEGEPTLDEELGTAVDLAACITEDVAKLVRPIADAQLENDPTLDVAVGQVRLVTRYTLEAGKNLCRVLVQAGGTGAPSITWFNEHMCRAHVAASLHTAMRNQLGTE